MAEAGAERRRTIAIAWIPASGCGYTDSGGMTGGLANLGAMTARELIRRLERAGWVTVRQEGSHRHFKHRDYPFIITVPMHKGDLAQGLALAILKQAGLD